MESELIKNLKIQLYNAEKSEKYKDLLENSICPICSNILKYDINKYDFRGDYGNHGYTSKIYCENCGFEINDKKENQYLEEETDESKILESLYYKLENINKISHINDLKKLRKFIKKSKKYCEENNKNLYDYILEKTAPYTQIGDFI
jgi:C4-type Zn-finger protein